MNRHSACDQKILKITPVLDEDYNPFASNQLSLVLLEDIVKDLQFLTDMLCQTLTRLRLPISRPKPQTDLPDLVASMYYMIPLLCDYSKVHTQQIVLRNSSPESKEISVTMRSTEDLLGRIFEFPEEGMYLCSDECKDLASLIIGAIRDSSSIILKKQIRKLEEKTIEFGRKMLASRNSSNKYEKL